MKRLSRYAFIVALLTLVLPSFASAQLKFSNDTNSRFSPGDVALPGGGTAAINNPVSIAVGDFNNDGKLDMAVINGLPIKVGTDFKFYLSVFLGTGTSGLGAFGDPVVTEIGGPCPSNTKNLLECDRGVFVMKGDFNKDGNDDLAIIFFGNPGANPPVAGKVEIFLSNGDGTFLDPTTRTYPVGLGAVRGVVADFDQDTNLDIAVANREAGSVSVLFGNGTGTFTGNCNGTGDCDQTTSGIGKRPVSVAAGDFDEDGKLDLAVVNTGDNDVSILLYDTVHPRTFKAAPDCTAAKHTCTVGTLPIIAVAANFDGDSHVDIAVVDQQTKTVTMLLGDGTGKFTSPAKKKTPVGKVPVDMIADDFNGDGTLDLALAFFSGHIVAVFPGIGDGTFGTSLSFKSTGTIGGGSNTKSIANFAIASGDFDPIDRSGGTSTLSRSADAGTGVTFTINGGTATFTADDVGRSIVSGSARAMITAFTDATHVVADILYSFAGLAEPIPAGSWFIRNKPDLAVPNGDVSVFFNETPFPTSVTVDVTFPNGGQTITLGSTQSITWNTSLVPPDFPFGNVKIDLLTDDGTTVTVKTITKSAPNNGTFLWKVGKTAAPMARIRVCSVNYPGVCDESDADFTIQ
jgi:VCBS repeat protein